MSSSWGLTAFGSWSFLLDIESRSELCGMQDFWRFGIRKMVLYHIVRLLPIADVLPNVYCIIWLLHQYALCAVVLLISWCGIAISYYLFSTPQYSIFYFLYSFYFYFGSPSSSSPSFRKSFFFWIPFFKFFQFRKSFFIFVMVFLLMYRFV